MAYNVPQLVFLEIKGTLKPLTSADTSEKETSNLLTLVAKPNSALNSIKNWLLASIESLLAA